MIQNSGRQVHTSSASQERRAEDRDEVFLRTIVTDVAGRIAAAELVNISQTGVLLRTKTKHRRSERLRLRLPGKGDVAISVVWSLPGCAGCRFADAWELTEYPGLLDAIRNAPADWIERAR